MKIKKIIQWLLHIVAAILLFCVFSWLLIHFSPGGLFLPSWIQWKQLDYHVEIEKESVHVLLKNRRVTISDPNQNPLWTSDRDWKVSQIWTWDIDHDDADEVILLVWKKGSFGDHKPFWIEENDQDWSQHIFIYEWDAARADRLRPIWMSSALGIQAAEVSIDGDGKITIVTPEGVRTHWYWDSWGLVRID